MSPSRHAALTPWRLVLTRSWAVAVRWQLSGCPRPPARAASHKRIGCLGAEEGKEQTGTTVRCVPPSGGGTANAGMGDGGLSEADATQAGSGQPVGRGCSLQVVGTCGRMHVRRSLPKGAHPLAARGTMSLHLPPQLCNQGTHTAATGSASQAHAPGSGVFSSQLAPVARLPFTADSVRPRRAPALPPDACRRCRRWPGCVGARGGSAPLPAGAAEPAPAQAPAASAPTLSCSARLDATLSAACCLVRSSPAARATARSVERSGRKGARVALPPVSACCRGSSCSVGGAGAGSNAKAAATVAR